MSHHQPLVGTLMAVALVCAGGCGRLVFQPQQTAQQLAITPEQQQAVAQQQQQLLTRAEDLDRDNQELETLLAQSRQQTQLMRDQLVAAQDQLKVTSERLAATQQNNSELQAKTQTLFASTQAAAAPRVAEIRPNNTLLKPLQASTIPGVEARQDGDTIRVTLPADQLFAAGTAQLSPTGESLLRNVAAELVANYPEQIIGIEGHTDSVSPSSPQFPTPQHLTAAQAASAYDVLRRNQVAPPQQFFVIGQGSNHPRMSNATPTGQAQNRRLELVVYPEVVRRR